MLAWVALSAAERYRSRRIRVQSPRHSVSPKNSCLLNCVTLCNINASEGPSGTLGLCSTWNIRTKEPKLAEITAEPIEKQDVSQHDEAVEPPKRGRGRPRSQRPEDEGETGETQPFFTRIKGYSETDWQEILSLYLYRCEPYTDRKASGNHKYIRKYTKAIEEEDVKLDFGSGGYKVMLIAFDPQTSKYKQMETHFFSIMDPAYPPKIPLGDWVDDDRNKEWAWAKPQLEAEAAKSKVGSSAPGVAGTDLATFNAIWDRVQQLNPGKGRDELGPMVQLIMQMVQGQMKANGDSQVNMMAVVDRIITAVKPGDGGSDLVKVLMAQNEAAERRASEERAANRDLMTKLLDRPAAPPPKSFMEELDLLAGAKEKLRGLFGRGEGGAKSTELLDVVRDLAPDVLKTIDHGVQGFIMSRGGKPQHRQPTVNVNPQLTQGNASQPTATPKPQTQEEQQVAMMTEINQRFGWVIDQVAPELSNIFIAGEPGMAFRELILEEFGNFAYNQVRKFSVETIITLIEIRKKQGDPTVQVRLQALQPPEKVAQFIQEFLSEEPYEPDEDDETPDEAATRTVKKTDF